MGWNILWTEADRYMKCMDRIRAFEGRVGYYMKPLPDGEAECFQEDLPLVAASVIKIPIMVTAFREIGAGRLDPDETVTLRAADKMPSCGALTYMHDGLQVTVMDLITLMIILSDNTATNLMIDRLSIDRVNETMAQLGIPGIALRRKLFDAEASARGVVNTVTARGIGLTLERMYSGTLLGGGADQKMLAILGDQRLNGKLPFYLHSRDIDVAHKTGEDEGTTHDCGIVYTDTPFVICMLSNDVDVPAFERLIQDTAKETAERFAR